MKLTLISIFISLISSVALSQGTQEDVIYLKNGYIYRGTILDHDTSDNYIIMTASGFVAHIAKTEIDRVAKEGKLLKYGDSAYRIEYLKFKYKDKGLLLQSQVAWGIYYAGVRGLIGYKFHRLAQLGIGVCVEYAESFTPSIPGAGYGPVYIHYGGDILRKQWTPFYNIECGYAFPLIADRGSVNEWGYDYQHREGGIAGGISIGCKYYGWFSNFNCSWSLMSDFIQASFHQWGSAHTHGPGILNYDYKNSATMYMIGTKFSIGF